LARRLTKAEIADQLNREGRRTPKGLSFTAKAIHWICWRYEIPPAQLNSLPPFIGDFFATTRCSASETAHPYSRSHGCFHL